MTPGRWTIKKGTLVQDPAGTRRELHSLHFTINQAIKNTYGVWVSAVFIVVLAWRDTPLWLALTWVFAVFLVFALRNLGLTPARDLTVLERRPTFWRNNLYGSTALCGAVAATGPAVFFPLVSDVYRVYMSMIFCSWLAGSMSSFGARPRLYLIYASIFATGIAAGWFRVESEFAVEFALMLMFFVAITGSFAWNFAARFNEGVEIRYANEQLVETLKVARAAAEESSAAKSRFLAVASHDLRQPLHAVSLLNGLLARPQSADKIAEISSQMGKALAALERLFNSVLDFSRIEADKVQPDLVWLPLPQLFSVLKASYASQAQSKGLTFSTTDLPILVRTDADLMERILRNLIENALKFTQQGSVKVGADIQGGELVITVCDSGPGIAANQREAVFKEYYQGGDNKQNSGLGLGLAIVRRLSDLLGFAVDVTDALPHGSQFNLHIPAELFRSEADDPDEHFQAPPLSEISGLLVAYVDDDAPSRAAMAMLLDDWGCRAVVAETLAELMRKLNDSDPPDALLTDFSLRNGETGLMVITAVRQRFGAVSAAILSGGSSAMDVHTMGELEYPVLRKPVAAKELRDLLEVFKNIG